MTGHSSRLSEAHPRWAWAGFGVKREPDPPCRAIRGEAYDGACSRQRTPAHAQGQMHVLHTRNGMAAFAAGAVDLP